MVKPQLKPVVSFVPFKGSQRFKALSLDPLQKVAKDPATEGEIGAIHAGIDSKTITT